MKKIYISLLLIIIIIGMSSSCLAAQFYDTIGTKYESPTEILYTLGIADGTSKNVFSANKPVTRAEMAKLILNVYGLGNQINGVSLGTYKFKDVKKTDWFYDYVNFAADMKIINGYSDGTFRPNNEVTYSEAVTMIIRALGYTELSVKAGENWDAPYIKKMNEIRLAKNVGYFKNSDAATRGNIAIMLCNMLNSESYVVVKDKTNVGLIKDTSAQKVITRYFSDYAIIDEDILEGISIYRGTVDDEEETEYYISTKEIDLVKVQEPIPLRRIGAKVSGIYNIEENMAIGLNFIYDEKFDEGLVVELNDIYKLPENKKNTYSLGKSKDYAYVYFDEEGKIGRVAYLGSNSDILIREVKIEKEKDDEGTQKREYALINEKSQISTSTILINKDGEVINWSSVKKGGVLSYLSNDMYVYSDATVKGELEKLTVKDAKVCLTVNGVLYACHEDAVYKLYGSETIKKVTKDDLSTYVGREVELKVSYTDEVMEISLDRNYENSSESVRFGVVVSTFENGEKTDKKTLRVATTEGKKMINVTKDVLNKDVEAGTLIHFELSKSNAEFIDVFSEGIKIPGGKLDMNIDEKSKEYAGSMIGDYEIDENTVIYVIEKEYQVNSDKSIKDYHMRVEKDADVLRDLENYAVHILYDEYNVAVAIFIEKEVNKYEYKYARVLEIYQEKNDEDKNEEKYILKIRVSPFNNVTSEYVVSGNISCEPGDLISYTTDDDKLIMKERYNTEILGDKRDLIVESVKGNIAYFTNDDKIDFSKNKFEVDGKEYLFEKYVVVYSRVTKLSGKWKFFSAEIVEPEDLRVEAGDRIAIDEIEDLFIVYRGYED